ncbi:Assimilatory nitrite reductase (NAD(P)H) small subunit [Candidatus Sulfopaludibacter sp. SbA3]|nr:Assimilatory nitrite reductase (NAD(P)H) small subunit [Candidatus Sulfopaludibacter sp. SbA3]
MSWIRITNAADFPLREGRAVTLGGEEIAIFNLGERFLAVSNRCPHRGGPLADGILSGDSVVCPLHAWKVCLTSGEVKRPPEQDACARTFPVKVVDGVVHVQWAAVQAEAA